MVDECYRLQCIVTKLKIVNNNVFNLDFFNAFILDCHLNYFFKDHLNCFEVYIIFMCSNMHLIY